MKKNVLVFGSIAGLVVALLMMASMIYYHYHPDFEGGMIVGYASMLLAFSFVFVGIKNFRDKYNDGLISFGKAFRVGLYIMLIASTIYVLVWLVEYYCFMPDFMDKYVQHALEQAKASGFPQSDIDAQAKEMATYVEMYKNPVWVILLTYMEILPLGLVVVLIAALILKRKGKKVIA